MEQNQEKVLNSLFLVSSAIHAKHGIYNTQERFVQTLRTCRSIRNKVSDSTIYLLDGGYKNISNIEEKELKCHSDKFYNFSENKNVINAQAIGNHDIVKNFIELYMFSTYLNDHHESLSKNFSRIFKISGRYRLNDNFDYNYHLNAKNKIVIIGPYKSQFHAYTTGNIQYQYMSRLWSFDTTMTTYIKSCYHTMVHDMMNRINDGGYIDIEHLLYKHLDSKVIAHPNKIGIEGMIAPNGMMIEE
jgi:hypothetical protein